MSSHSSALVAAPPAKGHTTPRIFTPPLPSNCDTDRADGCLCGCGLNPDTSWGFECIAFLENVLHWELIRYQKWLYIHALEKDETGLGFRFEIIVILIARQNGMRSPVFLGQLPEGLFHAAACRFRRSVWT